MKKNFFHSFTRAILTPLTSAFVAEDAAVASDDAVPPDTRALKIGNNIITLIGQTLVLK